MSDDFLEQFNGLIPQSVKDEHPDRILEVLEGWKQYFNEYHIGFNQQREEFDGIMRMRMASLIMSVAPPTDEEKGRKDD